MLHSRGIISFSITFTEQKKRPRQRFANTQQQRSIIDLMPLQPRACLSPYQNDNNAYNINNNGNGKCVSNVI